VKAALGLRARGVGDGASMQRHVALLVALVREVA
jgi:hypothetical protein